MLEKRNYFVLLKDLYGPLLTEKQFYIMGLYYDNDLSLSEIAENIEITRQGVYDIIKRAENALEEYESKLGLAKKFQQTKKHIDEVYELLNTEKLDEESVKKAINILEQVMDLI